MTVPNSIQADYEDAIRMVEFGVLDEGSDYFIAVKKAAEEDSARFLAERREAAAEVVEN